MRIIIDTAENSLVADGQRLDLYGKEAFELLSDLWLKTSWNSEKAIRRRQIEHENPIVGEQTLHSHDGIDRIWKMLEDIIEDDGIERANATQVLREDSGSTAKPLLPATAASGPGSLPCTIIPRRSAASRNHPFPHPGSSRRASLRVL